MINKILKKLLNTEEAHAHCDIPCGIYDPYPAQIDAHTVLRMIDLIDDLDENDPDYDVHFSRYMATKEEHGEDLKNKIRVIFGDFMAPGKGIEEDHPNLTGLVRKIMKQASTARQTADRDAALKLIDSVNEFSEIFWDIKGKSTKRIPSPYPTDAEMVVPE